MTNQATLNEEGPGDEIDFESSSEEVSRDGFIFGTRSWLKASAEEKAQEQPKDIYIESEILHVHQEEGPDDEKDFEASSMVSYSRAEMNDLPTIIEGVTDESHEEEDESEAPSEESMIICRSGEQGPIPLDVEDEEVIQFVADKIEQKPSVNTLLENEEGEFEIRWARIDKKTGKALKLNEEESTSKEPEVPIDATEGKNDLQQIEDERQKEQYTGTSSLLKHASSLEAGQKESIVSIRKDNSKINFRSFQALN